MLKINDLISMPDGIYGIDGAGSIYDYAEKWSYGYAVGLHPLLLEEVQPHILFGVWWRDDSYYPTEYDLVRHVEGYEDAMDLARLNKQTFIWDFRAHYAVEVL